jgi:autotransporter-associated beta strand protein
MLLLAMPAMADVVEWTGSVATTNWADNANWTGGAAPTGSNELTLRFGNVALTGTGNAANNDIGTFILNSVDFVNAGYALSGGDLQFQATSGAVNPTITVNVATTGYNQSIANNLILDNDLTIGGTGFGLLTLSGAISGAGGLTVNHETILSGSNSFVGNVAVNANLHVQNSAALGSGVVTVGSGFKLITDGSSTTAIANAITGSGSLLVQRETVLTGSNTFSGGLTAQANVRVDASNNLGTGLVTLGGTGAAGDVWLTVRQDAVNIANNIVVEAGGGGDVFIQALLSTAPTVSSTVTFSGNVTLNTYAKFHAGQGLLTQVMSGAITGSGFQKDGPGVVVLTASNTFGKFGVNTGTLQLDVDQVVTTATLLGGTLSGSGIVTAGYYDFSGGNLNARLGATGTIYQNTGVTVVQRSDAIGSLPVVMNGGTLLPGGTNFTISALAINGGTIKGTSGVITINCSPDASALATTAYLQAGVSIAGTRTMNVGGGALSMLDVTGSAYIIKSGSGALLLGSSNQFSGVKLDQGTLVIYSNSNPTTVGGTILGGPAGVGTLVLNGGAIAGNGGTTRTLLNAVSITGDFAVGSPTTGNTGAITLNGPVTMGNNSQITANSNLTFGGGLSGSGYTLTKAGAGSLTISGSASQASVLGGLTMDTVSGTVTIGVPLTLNGTFTQNGGGSLSVTGGSTLSLGGTGYFAGGGSGTASIAASISGSGGLVKSGSHYLYLSGSSTFTGNVTVSGGTLIINKDQSLGAAANSVVLADGAAFGANAAVALAASRTVSYGNGVTFNISGTLSFATANQLSGSGLLTKTGAGTLGR